MPASTPAQPEIPVALCLGGLDPSGGAGLLRDVSALGDFRVFPMAICTAETLQNGVACQRISLPALDPASCLLDLQVHLRKEWGVKLGLCLLEPSALQDLARRIREAKPKACIWDPIQAPTAGVGLHDAGALRQMAELLLPHEEWVVSPNRLEAASVAGLPPGAPPEALAKYWLALGAKAVWLKGGHAEGDGVEDFWIDALGARSLGVHPRLPGERRGTGCTLASAWLGFRLQGEADESAAEKAGAWLRRHWDDVVQPGGVGRPCFMPVRG